MAKFAYGKYAIAICDRCGQRYPLLELKAEWTGVHVCETCFDTKHPQLTPPKNIQDPEAIKDPRPDRVEPAVDTSAFDLIYPKSFRP